MKCGESFYIGIARYAKPVTKMVYNGMLLKLCIRIKCYISLLVFRILIRFYIFPFLFVVNDSYMHIYRAYRSADMATSVKTEPHTDMMDM